jgi:hypothetical protein
MATGTYPISSPRLLVRRRPRRVMTPQGIIVDRRVRGRPPEPRKESEGTPLLRLFGVAVLGWFGIMVVVVLLAV